MELFIGNKNYSSWSLRAWYLMSKFELEFDEIQLVLDTPDFYSELKNILQFKKYPY